MWAYYFSFIRERKLDVLHYSISRDRKYRDELYLIYSSLKSVNNSVSIHVGPYCAKQSPEWARFGRRLSVIGRTPQSAIRFAKSKQPKDQPDSPANPTKCEFHKKN